MRPRKCFDEARHVEVYDRYLREKFELVYPISPHLKQLLDTILTDSRWDFKYLGMQIMVEGVALGAFGFVHQTSTEPLIRQITEFIMKDESRHVAFGVLALKDMYKDMPIRKSSATAKTSCSRGSQLLRDRFLGQEIWERVGLAEKTLRRAQRKKRADVAVPQAAFQQNRSEREKARICSRRTFARGSSAST